MFPCARSIRTFIVVLPYVFIAFGNDSELESYTVGKKPSFSCFVTNTYP